MGDKTISADIKVLQTRIAFKVFNAAKMRLKLLRLPNNNSYFLMFFFFSLLSCQIFYVLIKNARNPY